MYFEFGFTINTRFYLDIFDKVVPYLDKETRKAYAGRQLVSRKLLDGELYNIFSNFVFANLHCRKH